MRRLQLIVTCICDTCVAGTWSGTVVAVSTTLVLMASSVNVQGSDAPLFDVGRVQYTLPAPLIHVAAAANKLVLCLSPFDGMPMRIVYLDLEEPAFTQEAFISSPTQARGSRWRDLHESTRVFVDASAVHVLLCAGTYTYYWTPGWTRARRIMQLDGVPVTAAVFGEPRATPPVALPPLTGGRRWIWTPPILLGTARGDLVETVLTAQLGGSDDRMDIFDRWARMSAGSTEYPLERGVYRLYSLASDANAITGLALEMQGQNVVIVVATSSRLYEFVGLSSEVPGPVFQRVFDQYQQSSQSQWKTDLPRGKGTLVTATLPVSWPYGSHRAMSWMNGAGVYAAQLLPDKGVCHADLFALPQRDDTPISLGRTSLHHVLVYSDMAVCMNALDADVQYKVTLPLVAEERVLGIAMDSSSDTCWIYTSLGGLYELLVKDEARDMWHLLLKRCDFEKALAFCHDETCRKQVLEKKGDALLHAGQLMEAVECYAQAQTPAFEQVVLSLMDVCADKALRRYVRLRLDKMPKQARVPRLMLATWLIELYVAAIQAQEPTSEYYQTLLLEAQEILERHHDALDARTTYALLARQQCTELWLAYACILQDTDKLVQHWIDQKQWNQALHTLSAQSALDAYYASSIALMQHAPEATIQCWQKCDQLDVERLIPALLQYTPAPNESDVVLMYLQHVIDVQGSKSPAAHALRLSRLCERASNQSALLKFVESASPGALDLSYALRVCSEAGCREACVRIYARLQQYENAVHLALEANDIDLACSCADLAAHGPSGLQRELWLQCAKHVVQSQASMEDAMAFLHRTDLLTVEDILPFFPDFSVIDGFKTEICDTLEGYVTRIDALKENMERTSVTAANIQQDIDRLSKRTIEIDTEHRCMQCATALLQRQFYLFPCRHGFHADCLTQLVTQHLSSRRLRRLLQLQNELAAADGTSEPRPTSPTKSKVSSSSFPLSTSLERLREHVRPQAIVDAITAGLSVGVASGRRALAPLDPSMSIRPASKGKSSTQAESANASVTSASWTAQLDKLRAELNTIVAGTCPICTLSVRNITAPFPDEKDHEGDDADWIV